MQRGRFELNWWLYYSLSKNATYSTLLYSTDNATSQAIFGPTLFDSSHFFEHAKLAPASSPTE
jgi:hypothetical protein